MKYFKILRSENEKSGLKLDSWPQQLLSKVSISSLKGLSTRELVSNKEFFIQFAILILNIFEESEISYTGLDGFVFECGGNKHTGRCQLH